MDGDRRNGRGQHQIAAPIHAMSSLTQLAGHGGQGSHLNRWSYGSQRYQNSDMIWGLRPLTSELKYHVSLTWPFPDFHTGDRRGVG